MLNVVDVKTIKASEKLVIETEIQSKELIIRAAKEIFCSYRYKNKTAIVCGSGNNGSDGYVLANLLFDNGDICHIYLTSEKFTDEGKYFYNLCKNKGIKSYIANENTDFSGYDTIVDCIFGIGFYGTVDLKTEKIIKNINCSGAYIISVDINSGLNADNGLHNICVKSNLTLSIGTLKSGLLLNQAKDVVGKLQNLDIGIPTPKKYQLLEVSDFKEYLNNRKNYSHKGNYGYTAIMGGCFNYSGAVKLSAIASGALRSGCGVVRVIIPDRIYCSFAQHIEEATIFCMNSKRDGHIKFNSKQITNALKNIKALAIGMGWGNGKDNYKILKYIIENFDIPIIIDADGLNAIAKCPDILMHKKSNIILTPHIKEFSRLSGKSCEEILSNPIESAERFSSKYKVITVLKGPTTIITDGNVTYLCDRGCPGMATAGSGDILSGIILSAVCQNSKNPLLSVAFATFINGIAGELAQDSFSDIGMTAKDTVTKIPDAIIYCRKIIEK